MKKITLNKMNLNKVFLIGNLVADPEMRQTSSGQSVCSFRIATNRIWNDKSGQRQTQTEYHTCVAWGKQAETISTYLRKGNMIMVEGRLQTRSWDDKQTGAKRYTTEIVVENFQFGPKGATNPGTTNSKPASSKPTAKDNDENEEENLKDIPIINEDEEDIDINDIPL